MRIHPWLLLPGSLLFAATSSLAHESVEQPRFFRVDPVPIEAHSLEDMEIINGGVANTDGDAGIDTRVVYGDTIRIEQSSYQTGARTAMHHQVSEQFTLVIDGRLRFLSGDTDTVLESGDAVRIPPFIPHQFVADANTNTITIVGPDSDRAVEGLRPPLEEEIVTQLDGLTRAIPIQVYRSEYLPELSLDEMVQDRFGKGDIVGVPLLGDTIRLNRTTIRKGVAAALHNHPDEQMSLVLSGRLRASGGDLEFEIGPGDVVRFPAHMPHSVVALEDTVIIEGFGPGFETIFETFRPANLPSDSTPPHDYDYYLVHADERHTTQANVETLRRILEALATRNWEAVDELYADNYVQHNPQMRDGKEGVIELFESLNPDGLVYEQLAMLAEGPYVIAVSRLQFGPDQPELAVADINFIRDGKSREHWDIMMPVDGSGSAGRTMFDLRPPRDVPAQETESNKQLVADFINVVLNQKNVGRVEDFVSRDFIAYGGGDGPQAIVGALAATPGLEYDIKRIVGQGDTVLAHSQITIDNAQFAQVDIWRLRKGKLVEHWGVRQAVPDTMAHSNGMF